MSQLDSTVAVMQNDLKNMGKDLHKILKMLEDYKVLQDRVHRIDNIVKIISGIFLAAICGGLVNLIFIQ